MANAVRCKQFTQISGWIITFIGLIGFFLTDLFGLIQFDVPHNVLYVVLGTISLWLGYKGTEAMQVNWAKVGGTIYLLLCIVGFFTAIGPVGLDLGENGIHLVLGLWGIWAGFLST